MKGRPNDSRMQVIKNPSFETNAFATNFKVAVS